MLLKVSMEKFTKSCLFIFMVLKSVGKVDEKMKVLRPSTRYQWIGNFMVTSLVTPKSGSDQRSNAVIGGTRFFGVRLIREGVRGGRLDVLSNISA